MALESTQDLLKETLRQAGEEDNGQSQFQSQALEFLNTAYLSVLSGNTEFDIDIGEPWYWALESQPTILKLRKAIDLDAVTLTSDSAAGVFGAAPAESYAGWHLIIEGTAERYIILAHVAGQANFTIDSDFLGATGLHNSSVAKLIYDLGADILRLVEPIRVYKLNLSTDNDYKIYSTSTINMRREFPLARVRREIPVRFAVIYQDKASFKIQLSSIPTENMKAEFDFIKTPSALIDDPNDFPRIPIQHVKILTYMASSKILFNYKSEDKKGSVMFNFAKAMWKSMFEQKNKQAMNTSKDRGRLIPRRDKMRGAGHRNRLFKQY